MSSVVVITLLPMLLGIAIGCGLPLQTAINSQLRGALGSPFRASLVSFAVGTAALGVIVALSGEGVGLPAGFVVSEPWWIWLGGVLGVIFLTGNIVIFPKLGGVQTVVMPILGQIIASNVIDMGGWFGLPVHPMSVVRVLGICLAVVGIAIAVVLPDLRAVGSSGTSSVSSQAVSMRWLWQCTGVLLGALSAGQTAINGHLGSELGSATHAALISFAIGSLLLAIIVFVQQIRSHNNSQWSSSRQTSDLQRTRRLDSSPARGLARVSGTPWWFWIGGLLGAAFVFGNSYLAPLLGTGLTVVIVLLGQICAGLAVDRFGLLRARRRKVTLLQMLGVAVLLAGVIIIRMS